MDTEPSKNPDDGADEIEASRAPLIEHLIELRTRLIWSMVGLAIAFVVSFIFATQIFNLLLIPYERAVGEIGRASCRERV